MWRGASKPKSHPAIPSSCCFWVRIRKGKALVEWHEHGKLLRYSRKHILIAYAHLGYTTEEEEFLFEVNHQMRQQKLESVIQSLTGQQQRSEGPDWVALLASLKKPSSIVSRNNAATTARDSQSKTITRGGAVSSNGNEDRKTNIQSLSEKVQGKRLEHRLNAEAEEETYVREHISRVVDEMQ